MLCVTSLFQYYTRYASYKSTAKENMRKKLEKLPLLATRPLYNTQVLFAIAAFPIPYYHRFKKTKSKY